MKAIQTQNGLKDTGVVDEETWNVIFNDNRVVLPGHTPKPTPEPTPEPDPDPDPAPEPDPDPDPTPEPDPGPAPEDGE